MLWAKTYPDDQDAFYSLHRHMEDSAAVAQLLWREWLPERVTTSIASAAGGPAAGETLLAWLAGLHDLGKATPSFQSKVERLANRVHDAGLQVPAAASQHSIYHSTASYILLDEILADAGWPPASRKGLASVIGGHHGVPPTSQELRHIKSGDRRASLGDGEWSKSQHELVQHITRLTGADQFLESWRELQFPVSLLPVLTGAVIVADWIASNAALFGPRFSEPAQAQATKAWSALGLPGPWRAVPPPDDPPTALRTRFDFPAAAKPRPIQQDALRAANALAGAGLIVIEAAMGEGKTEAALLAAEALAAKTGAGGIAFLLPTQATSNAMFGRVHKWIERLLRATGSQATQTMFLAHGKSEFNEGFGSLPKWTASSMGDDAHPLSRSSDLAVAHTWLLGRKKGVLANFVIGTVDQVLMMALKAKHLALRHLAFAGKVVIIDEVHAYDAYMSAYLDRSLHWLGAHQVPVVLLSATLPPSRRAKLVAAYRDGLAAQQGSGFPAPPAPERHISGPSPYPLITVAAADAVRQVEPKAGLGTRQVRLAPLDDDDATLVETLRQVSEQGGCIGIIRNTVDRAQKTARLLEKELRAEVVLVHSRLIPEDRSAVESRLVRELGPDSATRPESLLVVGTQVLEQSLDIDFDLLITDLAPMDLLLQRMGRLHRHARGTAQSERPATLRQPTCLVTGVSDWQSVPPTPDGSVNAVYGTRGDAKGRASAASSPIVRTLAALRRFIEPAGTALELPQDIPRLVEEVYERTGVLPDTWEAAAAAADLAWDVFLDKKRAAAGAFLLGRVPTPRIGMLNWLSGKVESTGSGHVQPGATDDSAEGQRQVRDSEDSIEVILVQRRDGAIRLLPWLTLSDQPDSITDMSDSTVIPTDAEPDWRLARRVARCTVMLPPRLASPWLADKAIGELERDCFPGWQASRWLRGKLVLVLDQELQATIAGVTLTYDQRYGLQTTQPTEKKGGPA
ncbi:MAG: CRISPR-associated helicase Cas3' [Bifidobacteriaceae bacterium]|jgi:CRISPR-associated endonuclease/helicase Cas3|nr:CRISPR-associated helicase Cas3' [Bifidobacteriaceae bacterium]